MTRRASYFHRLEASLHRRGSDGTSLSINLAPSLGLTGDQVFGIIDAEVLLKDAWDVLDVAVGSDLNGPTIERTTRKPGVANLNGVANLVTKHGHQSRAPEC
jgi:hypothetical protein